LKFVKNTTLIWITVWLSACGEGDPKFGYEAANQPPISIAGVAQNVTTGSTVTLDGSASRDANGDPLTYRWSLTSKPTGSTASLAASSSAKPTFIADFPGTYVATLTVNDGKIDGTSSTVTVTASFYAAPVADPGVAQNVTTGSTVTLDGSASRDANGDPLTYRWSLTSKPTGSIAWLAQSTSAKPTFTADLPGTYVATLIVNDGKIDSTSSTVTVTVSSTNAAPVAYPGVPQNVTTGSTVTHDGSASQDANGDALTYRWSLTSKPTGSKASLASSSSAKPTFIADFPGTYVATLIVNDGKIDSTSNTVTVTASSTNAAPVADPGVAQNVTTGSTVTLDGSFSRDANGDPLTYRWSLTSKPTGSTASLASSGSVKPTFIADLPGIYVATLIVNDGKIDSTSSTVTVASSPPKVKGIGYVAPNGMTVTLTNFEQYDLGNGYIRYTATYLQENKTSLSIDEGSLKLYFKNADPEDQYASFGQIQPGPSFTLERRYSWEVPSSSDPMLLQYKSKFFSESVAGSLHWIFPIK
jgi:hypothetical protein